MTAHVISSGVTTGYTLHSGDTLTVLAGGTSLDTVISSGGAEYVSAAGRPRRPWSAWAERNRVHRRPRLGFSEFRGHSTYLLRPPVSDRACRG